MNDDTTRQEEQPPFGGKIGLGKRGKKMPKTLTMDELKARSVEELLQEVDDTQEPVRIVLAEGHEIDIKPAPKLKPMIRLEGYIPEGWKDAIYSQE